MRNIIKKEEIGITLIALVISIVVLLILAGVSISMLTGENGILKQTTDAKNKWNSATQNEVEQLDNITQIIDEITGEKVEIWKNRKWIAFGTSITDTNNTLAPDGTSTGKYVPYLTELSGMDLTNRGVAGARMSGHILYYVNYYSSDLRWADLVSIEGSVNDFVGCVPLGNVGDTIPYQDDSTLEIGGNVDGTFAGACYQIFKIVKEKAPRAVILYFTDNTGKKVASTGPNYTKDVVNALGLTQEDYVNMAVNVAERMGVKVIDAGRKSLIDEDHPDYLIDHIHHSELGGQRYAEVIWNELKYISPKEELLEPIFTGNYFDKNDSSIENGGIYLNSGTWYANANFFETGYIKVRTDANMRLLGVTGAVHFTYYDIDTKEFLKGSNNGPNSEGIVGFGKFQNSMPSYMKDYVYLRVGLPKANIDDIVITANTSN